MSLVDLHLHSTASDGSDSPEDIVVKAREAGLAAIALTDHDTLNGLKNAGREARRLDIEFIRGCELSTKAEVGEIHLLGLWAPDKSPGLENFFAHLRAGRKERNERIVAKLQAHGIDITFDEIAAKAQGAQGRPHIAQLLLEKGVAQSRKEAFDLWLGKDGKAFEPKPVPPTGDAVAALASAGASPILAHPLLYPTPAGWLESFVKKLIPQGLFGIEVWHSSHTEGQSLELLELARKYDLGVSGGSDYHGINKPDIQIGKGKGNLHIKYSVLENLKERRAKMGLPV